MMRKASATRIGAFVIGGVALLIAAVVAVGGGKLFASTERAVMHFSGSVYGLQVGAPVVLRGVRVGRVTAIGLEGDADSVGAYRIPVQAVIDRDELAAGVPGTGPLLPGLVRRGLQAQLTAQNLLTGLLYVDLDFKPGTPTAATRAAPAADPVQIPTAPAPVQALMTQLQALDVPRLIDDVQAIASSTRQLVGSAELKRGVQELAALSTELRQLTARLDRRIDPLADATQRTLAEARGALQAVSGAASQVGATGERLGAQVDTLVAAGTPALKSAQAAADELALSAAALRQATADDGTLMLNVERTAKDVSRAARALRELAELLERQPTAVIRGRGETP